MVDDHVELTSQRDPARATITVRVIKSFEYRTIKNVVFRDVDLNLLTPRLLLAKIHDHVSTQAAFRPYRTVDLNTLKIYTHAHLTKTMNLSINLDHDDWILTDLDKPLAASGIRNESELSCFNFESYRQFVSNPEQKWDN